MNKRWFALAATGLAWMAAAMVLVWSTDLTGSENLSGLAWAAAPEAERAITEIDPSSAPNDLDTPIIITGTNFEDGAHVLLGGTSLEDIGWAGDTRLEATVSWGMDPGVYDLKVVNPGGESNDLPNAFTVTQGIGVWSAGALYGGEIEDLAINPDNPAILYAASPGVGLFRSRDAGENWSFVYASDARAVAVDPITPTTLYWRGGGTLNRSDDEAETWNRLNTEGEVPYVHPTVPGWVYASSRWGDGGLWKSEDYGEGWIDWTDGLTDTQIQVLAFHPADPMTMVVGTMNGNIFRSTNGGDTWSFASKPVELVESLAFNPDGGNELWVSDCCFCVPQYTYKSIDLDYTEWITVLAEPLTAIAFPPRIGWGDLYSNTVYAAGCWADAYKTDDGGDTWQDWGPTTGMWGWSIALDPTTAGSIYKASYRDGVYKTTDEGDTWRVVNEGLTALVPSQLAIALDQPDLVYAVVDGWGGVLEGTRGGEFWQFMECQGADAGPDGSMLVDPFTPGRLYRSGGIEIYRSDDEGQTWPISGTLDPPDACTVNVQTVSARVMKADPQQPGTLLAGTNVLCNDFDVMMGAIYRSTDHGESWMLIDAGQEISQVTDLAYDTWTPAIAYAATEGSGMLRSTNGGQNWQPMGEAIAELERVHSIAVEPVAPYRVFAQASWPGGLYVSANHGLSWTIATTWLNSEQILYTDEVPPALYAATWDGLLRSTDGGQTWTRAAGVLGQVPIYSLATVREGERVILYAGTTGGYVGGGASEALNQVDAEDTLVVAGVYRYTTLRRWWVYLPLVVRQQ